MFMLLLFSFTTAFITTIESSTDNSFVNDRPIIGVLAQEQNYFPAFSTYLAASYVKGIEAAGARVIPIMALFPGGEAYFNESNGYADAGQHIYEIAQELYEAGDYFPIFGTCLGFELLVILASGRGEKDNKVPCSAHGNFYLEFSDEFRSSKMFSGASKDDMKLLMTKNITVNAHDFCITDQNMASYNLTKDWRVNSYSYDNNGLKFISSLEHRRYPFYGTQFHPEKPAFEWNKSRNYTHTKEAVQTSRHFMDFFISEARKNRHNFSSPTEENDYLIYNYRAYFTGKLGSFFDQLYLFE